MFTLLNNEGYGSCKVCPRVSKLKMLVRIPG